MNYNYPEHRAKNLNSALKLAKQLKKAGKFDLFRGQTHTYPVRPSIARQPELIDTNQALLNRFASWVHEQETLKSLHDDPDAIMAVAQHYGMATPFLDFTTEPDVAAFFASYTNDQRPPEGTACILCLNRNVFEKSWEDLNERYRTSTGKNLVRVVEIDVNNLWRLHAQRGLFIDVRVATDLFEMFSRMLHIYFPLPASHDLTLNDKYYPKNKSHLELLLDQHFLIETYDNREALLKQMFDTVITSSNFHRVGERGAFSDGELPHAHPSWCSNSLEPWETEPSEGFDLEAAPVMHVLTINTRLDANSAATSLHAQVLAKIHEYNARKWQRNSWEVRNQSGEMVHEDEGHLDDRALPLGDIVGLIFDGMRLKPFDDSEIASAIANYITLHCFPAWETMTQWWGTVTGIELDGNNVRVRGFCGGQTLSDALRTDFSELLTPEALENFETEGISRALDFVIEPRRLFEFGKFRKMFAEQVIPTTAYVRVEGYVLHYNIADIRVFGLS